MANLETVILGGGCFWCLEAVFDRLSGVKSVESGYAGGKIENPTYRQVCTGTTDHVEVVCVTFDPAQLSYQELLEVFFTVHDPTTLNRQGADVGTQYRSAVFYHNQQQKEKAEYYKAQLNKEGAYDKPIVTEITAFSTFYPAEDYHQEYFANNASEPYCQLVVSPKVKKFQQKFAAKMKA